MMEAEVRERFEVAMLLALKVEEDATSQEKKVTLRSWKRQGNRFCPQSQLCGHFNFSQVKLT